MLLVLLVVQLLRRLLLCNLLLGCLELLVNGQEHAFLLLRLFLLLFFRIDFEELFGYVQQLPQVGIFRLQLLNVEFICLNNTFSHVPIVLYDGDLEFVALLPVEL